MKSTRCGKFEKAAKARQAFASEKNYRSKTVHRAITNLRTQRATDAAIGRPGGQNG
jgi:hypothetical protein